MFRHLKTITFAAKRLAREAEIEAARQQIEAEERQRLKLAEEKRLQDIASRVEAYRSHVKAVDLNGIVTRDGSPLSLDEIFQEVPKRYKLAADAKSDRQIKLADEMTDESITAITDKIDQTALDWLIEHKDPERQRTAAGAVLDARANLDEVMSLNSYATVVAEAVARKHAKMAPNKVLLAVIVRAILLRSVDPRWTRMRNGQLRPLSQAPW